MKTVGILTGVGLWTLAVFACAGPLRVVEPAAPARVEAAPTVVEIFPETPKAEAPARVVEEPLRWVTPAEFRKGFEIGTVKGPKEQAPALDYSRFSRAGPWKHRNLAKKPAPEEDHAD